MIRYIYGDELHQFGRLQDTMFRDRRTQFFDRLGWDVRVDENGHERDDYDNMNPLYVIWERQDGTHGGSLRFLPTVGRTMVNDHFLNLTDGVEIRHPMIWECTRFCLAEDTELQVSAALMLAGLELGLGFHLRHTVGVFDRRMQRFYRMMGWSPTIVGESGDSKGAICVGLWSFDRSIRQPLLRRAGIDSELSEFWFERAFNQNWRLGLAG